MYSYIPEDVCSTRIDVELDGDIIKSVSFTGGCDGNLRAISKLVKGKDAHEIIGILRGNLCRGGTSCADQLTYALEGALKQQE